MTALMRGEMPLRVVDTGAGYAIRALCGAESAVLVGTTADTAVPVVRANGGMAARNPAARADAHPMAVVRMALHCASCGTCQARQAAAAATPGAVP